MNTPQQSSASWWHRPLLRLYQSLTRTDPPQPADLIVVIAGTMPRKPYGLDLFRAGYAPSLLLSVGRFEVSKMRGIGFEASDELEALRNRTPPEERNFFIWIDRDGIQIHKSELPAWSTYGEALALRKFLAHRGVQKILVVSTAIHLRRLALTFRRIFAGTSIQFLFCPVPEGMDVVQREKWWTRRRDSRFVISEALKFAGYWLWLPWLRAAATKRKTT